MEQDARIGRVLDDKYELVEYLGEGATATIYRGRQLAGGPDVAVKLLKYPDIMTVEELEHRARRFRREALSISRLAHPNTIRLLDYGTMPGGMGYMVLELLAGESLLEHIRSRQKPDLELLAEVARQVVGALGEAHEQGMIHRDLKPENVFLVPTADGKITAKVVDFGAVAVIAPSLKEKDLTAAGATVGSAPYMSPEQVQAEGVTAKSDYYSLGVSLYEGLTGELPFEGGFVELMSQHCFSEPPRLEVPGIPAAVVAEWQALLDKLLSKDPANRPSSSEDIAAELTHLREVSAGRAAPRAQAATGQGSSKALLIAAAAAVAVATAVVVILAAG